MELFILVIAILFLQIWGAENPLHRDEWLWQWQAYLQKRFGLSPAMLFAACVGLPMLAVAVLMWLIALNSYWPLLPVGVVLLLYSFGRGEFSEILQDYTHACSEGDWDRGMVAAQRLAVDVDAVAVEDWSALHEKVLEQAAYRGFERMFAVLFWFFMLGPIGAVLYRLVFLFTERSGAEVAEARTLLWLLEWPAVRILGLSFALTGNFVGCIQRWRESVLSVSRSTETTIGQSVLGALSVDDDLSQTCDVTRKELELLDSLFRRTLWFWLAAAAIVIIIY